MNPCVKGEALLEVDGFMVERDPMTCLDKISFE
jgi:hypothetical protein